MWVPNYNMNNQNQQAGSYKPWGQDNGQKYNKNKLENIGAKLIDVDWKQQNLQPFQKVFYKPGLLNHSLKTIQEWRTTHGISISSSDDLYPFIEWQDTHFPSYIMKSVENSKFASPTSIQAQSFPIILSGHDLIGIAKTGSGKTLSFLLPAIVHINAQPQVKKGDGPIVLVLAPTRELAMQIQEQAELFGKTCKLLSTCIYGGADKYPQKKKLLNGLDMIVATPGRLIDFLESGDTNLKRVTYMVLDEADRMLDMGFEPQIRKIMGQIRPDRQTMMFTATWPKEVRQLASDICHGDPIQIQIGSSDQTVNTDIKQTIEIVGDDQKTQRLIKFLDAFTGNDKILIFCATKKGCEDLCRTLNSEGFKTISIHGDKTQVQRDRAIEDFKSTKFRILIATDVASRGLDIKEITYVINFDLPKNLEDYIHRIGRTGRAGAKGTSISFFNPEMDFRMGRELLEFIKSSQQRVPSEVEDLIYNLDKGKKDNKYQKSYQPYQKSSGTHTYFNKPSYGAQQQQQSSNYYGQSSYQPQQQPTVGGPQAPPVQQPFYNYPFQAQQYPQVQPLQVQQFQQVKQMQQQAQSYSTGVVGGTTDTLNKKVSNNNDDKEKNRSRSRSEKRYNNGKKENQFDY